MFTSLSYLRFYSNNPACDCGITVKTLFGLYLKWCEPMRFNVNIGKCSVARLMKPASAAQKGGLSLALDRRRFPIRHQRVNTPLTAENEGRISRVSAHWVLDMLCGDI